MSQRRLFLLSPYRMPTNHQVFLSEDEVATWLNAYLSLWHPALIRGAAAPPDAASAYDHEKPEAGDVFAVPESPPLYQTDDWPNRMKEAGAFAWTPVADWTRNALSLRQALEEVDQRDVANPARAILRDDATKRLMDLPYESCLPFLGLGYGFLVVESLYDAAEHEHLLDREAFWKEVQAAAERTLEGVDAGEQLREAGRMLMQARESLYPSRIFLLDLYTLNEAMLPELKGAAAAGHAANWIADGATLEKHHDAIAEIGKADGRYAVLGGLHKEREDGLLPLESQLWNLRTGVRRTSELTGETPAAFASKTTVFQPGSPSLFLEHNIKRAWHVSRDASVLPSHYAAVVNWPAPDGKSIDALTKTAQPANDSATYFNLAHTLHQSIGADSTPTFLLLHEKAETPVAFDAWMALSSLAPVFGDWQTLPKYFEETSAGEYAGATNADDIFLDCLEPRITRPVSDPVTGFAKHALARREVDAALTWETIRHVLNRGTEPVHLQAIEDTFESDGVTNGEALQAAGRLAERLTRRAASTEPGWLTLNSCGFTRRYALDLNGVRGPIPVEGAVKAADLQGDKARVVVEVPPLGFAWIPNTGKGTPSKQRVKMTEANIIRNEFIEVEVDPQSGGIRGFRDTRTRINRLGQQLVFNPGSKMVAEKVEITQSGPVFAEIVSEGALRGDHDDVLARFKQSLRIWLSRPILEMEVTLEPTQEPSGYPWHSYHGSRFAWRDERAALLRGINGNNTLTNHSRPQTGEYLEIRSGKNNVAIFPNGMPFHQKHGNRMIDVLLRPAGETAKTFMLHLGIDREMPYQTAQGLLSPSIAVPLTQGPPAVGPSGWLFHVDATNLVLTSMRPAAGEAGTCGAILQFIETAGTSGMAEIRCVRDPKRAVRVNGLDEEQHQIGCNGDAVSLEFSAHEAPRICIWFD